MFVPSGDGTEFGAGTGASLGADVAGAGGGFALTTGVVNDSWEKITGQQADFGGESKEAPEPGQGAAEHSDLVGDIRTTHAEVLADAAGVTGADKAVEATQNSMGGQ